MKFDFSKSSDLQNKFQYIYKRLDILLTISRYNNQLLLEMKRLERVDKGLQTQVDEYYDEVGSPPTSGSPNHELEDK